MSRERIKSLVLAVLVMINFVLGAKILNEKKLWPYGYNFFAFIENTDIYKAVKNNNKAVTKTHITMPQQIFVNTGDQTSRILLRPDNALFSQVYSASAETLVSALRAGSKNIRPADKEEWVSALNGKSLYFCYATEYDTKLFGEFFASNSSDLSEFVNSFSEVIITAEKKVFFEDYTTGRFYSAVSGASTKEISAEIDKMKNETGGEIINYSVELKFDESLGGQTATLAATAPVYSTPVALPAVRAVNPLIGISGGLDSEVTEKILSVFKINSGNVRSYPETDGTLVFVENNGILKIHPGGALEYQSTASGGFSLSADNSYVDTVIALANFTDKISAAAGTESDFYISNKLSEKSPDVTFDCRIGGVPVKTDLYGAQNAVSAEIKNGALIRYKQILRRYVPDETDIFTLQPFITALDNAAEKYSKDMRSIEIQNIYPVYTDDGTKTFYTADWYAQIRSIELGGEGVR